MHLLHRQPQVRSEAGSTTSTAPARFLFDATWSNSNADPTQPQAGQ